MPSAASLQPGPSQPLCLRAYLGCCRQAKDKASCQLQIPTLWHWLSCQLQQPSRLLCWQHPCARAQGAGCTWCWCWGLLYGQ